MKFVINGIFFTTQTNGITRFAREVLLELDGIITDRDIVELLVPSNSLDIPDLMNIKVVTCGKIKRKSGSRMFWEQLVLPYYCRKQKSICINLTSTPQLIWKNITVIHDLNFIVNPHHYAGRQKILKVLYFLSINRIEKILTVSEFSKKEICQTLSIDPLKVFIIQNGWQHFNRIDCQPNILQKYSLEKNKYFFSVGSLAPHKNIDWIVKNAKYNRESIYVIAGEEDRRVFSCLGDVEKPQNVFFLGRLSDVEIKTLMKYCKGFIFPSLHEGFGIPPLEALASGCKDIVIANATSLPEIFGSSAHYLDPLNPNIKIDELISTPTSSINEILSKYSWSNAAKILYELIKE